MEAVWHEGETGLEERDQCNTLCSLRVRAGTHKEAEAELGLLNWGFICLL